MDAGSAAAAVPGGRIGVLRRLRGRRGRRPGSSRSPGLIRPIAACSALRRRCCREAVTGRARFSCSALSPLITSWGRGWPGRWRSAPAIAARCETRTVDPAAVWRAAFLRGPHLRDGFVRLGLVAETFETAVTWDRFWEFHEGVLAAVGRRCDQACGGGMVSCRFAYVYPDGPAPYYSVYAPGRPGAGTRAVGSDQARGVGGDPRARRHDHPPSRGRPRPPPVVPARGAAAVHRRAARRQGSAGPGRDHEPGGIDAVSQHPERRSPRRQAMTSTDSAPASAPGPGEVPGKVFRSELNPVDFLRRAAYMYPDKTAVVRRRAALLLPAARRAVLAAGQRAAVGGPGQGGSGRHAAVQLPGDAGGPFRRPGRGRDPGRGQPPPGQRRGRLHPGAQRRAVPAAGRRARGAGRGRSSWPG